MTLSQDDRKILLKIYETLLVDDEWRNKFISVLNPDYVKRDELHKVLEELKKQREDFNKRFEAVDKRFEAVDKRFEELIDSMNKRFEESNKRYEELREDMNKRFEAVDKRFEESNKRYEELREDMNKRFEAVDKRFEELIYSMNKRFEAMQQQLDIRFAEVFERLDNLSEAFGHDFEEFNSYWLETFLIEQGYPHVKVQKKIFYDENYEVFPDSKQVEIDLFNEKPLVIGEVTAVVRRIEKVTTFLRKIDFIEKRFGKAEYKLFITYAILPEIRDEAIKLLEEAKVDVIILRKKAKIERYD